MTKVASLLQITSLVVALDASGAQRPQPTADDWRQANLATTRLDAAQFDQLPAAVRADLTRRGCTVPQPSGSRGPANVVNGEFMQAGRTDWAVLCSRDRVSAILVYPAGTTDTVQELASAEDATYLQVVDGRGTIGFSRQLSVANSAAISRYLSRAGSAGTRAIRSGIEDAFVGKASSIWYWNGTRWQQLRAAD